MQSKDTTWDPTLRPICFHLYVYALKLPKMEDWPKRLFSFCFSNKHHTENNLISAAVLIWVFTNKRPTFVLALDIKRYENQVAWQIRPQPTRELLSF